MKHSSNTVQQCITKLLLILSFTFSVSSVLADNGKPDLWSFEKDGKLSYLFGSIHLGLEDMYPLSDAVNKAYNSVDALTVEFDFKPEDQVKMLPLITQYGVDRTSQLEQRLSPKTRAVYQKACKEQQLPCEQFAPLKPWLASLQIAIMNVKKLGYKAELGIDQHFMSMAHAENKPVISLESMDSQIQMLVGLTEAQQELMLVQTLEETGDFLKELLTAWKTGDDSTMSKLLTSDMDNPDAQLMHKAIFDDRNVAMANGVMTQIEQGKTLLVVVGAGHIIGENGIVELLKKNGYRVKQVQ